ncbi:MAG: ABC-type transport auxiliary lipoprotein family protein [Proteobacteria bacterium]|nr:ABC-type transport auxiliary lipoprotein family protein [Pseudomonadota bacterium]
MKPGSRLLAPLAMSVLLAGCGGLLRSTAPAEQTFRLRSALPAVSNVAAIKTTLQLLPVAVQPGLDTTRIALVRPGNRLDWYADARWAGPLNDVVTALLAQSLRDSGRFAQVATDAAAMDADVVLAVTVRRFEAEQSAQGALPVAQVRLECTLSSLTAHRQLAAFTATAAVPAGANRLTDVVAALEQAAQQAVAEVVEQAAVRSAALSR